MIEITLKNLLDSVATTYAGGMPEGNTAPCIVYQVIMREESEYQEGYSHLSVTHFRLSIHAPTYGAAKLLVKDVKEAIQSSHLLWMAEGEYDVFQPPIDGSANYFNCVTMDLAFYSDEISEETDNAFSSGFSNGFGA